MINYTIKKRNREEEKKIEEDKSNNRREDMKKKIKKAIKSHKLLPTMMMKFGKKYFPNKNLSQDQ